LLFQPIFPASDPPFLHAVPADSRVPVIGLVGGVGSGKSSLARAAASGLPDFPNQSSPRIVIVSGDEAGHRVLTYPPVRDRIRERFGQSVFKPDGDVNRRALAQVVFGATPEATGARRDLEAIVHPEIKRLLKEQIDSLTEKEAIDVILLDAAVLLEAGWQPLCDAVVFVDVPFEERLRRVREGRGWDEADLRQREASQWPVERKRAHSTAVIENSGELSDAARGLSRLLEQVLLNRP
jgi:dephospho-CoA kinase